MNRNTGEIRPWSEVETLPEPEREAYRPMAVPPTPAQRAAGRIGRNDPCPCGSGEKFKRCCYRGQ